MGPQELANEIRSTPSWSGQNVRLLSCSTGSPEGSFAQDLSDELGVAVKAPTTDFGFSSRGIAYFEDGGEFKMFTPGG